MLPISRGIEVLIKEASKTETSLYSQPFQLSWQPSEDIKVILITSVGSMKWRGIANILDDGLISPNDANKPLKWTYIARYTEEMEAQSSFWCADNSALWKKKKNSPGL